LARSERRTISVTRFGMMFARPSWNTGPRVGAVSKQLLEEWELSEQCGQEHHATVAILNVGGRHKRMQQQTQCIDENVAFLAFDQLASIEPMSIDTDPPFPRFSRDGVRPKLIGLLVMV
jgi:hypothetical protein